METTGHGRSGGGLSRSADDSAANGGTFRRHRRLFFWLLVGWSLATALLVWLSSGPQNEPFVYQVF